MKVVHHFRLTVGCRQGGRGARSRGRSGYICRCLLYNNFRDRPPTDSGTALLSLAGNMPAQRCRHLALLPQPRDCRGFGSGLVRTSTYQVLHVRHKYPKPTGLGGPPDPTSMAPLAVRMQRRAPASAYDCGCRYGNTGEQQGMGMLLKH